MFLLGRSVKKIELESSIAWLLRIGRRDLLEWKCSEVHERIMNILQLQATKCCYNLEYHAESIYNHSMFIEQATGCVVKINPNV